MTNHLHPAKRIADMAESMSTAMNDVAEAVKLLEALKHEMEILKRHHVTADVDVVKTRCNASLELIIQAERSLRDELLKNTEFDDD